jgi:hypothetical protein
MFWAHHNLRKQGFYQVCNSVTLQPVSLLSVNPIAGKSDEHVERFTANTQAVTRSA